MPGFLAVALVLLSIGLRESALGPRGSDLTFILSFAALVPVVGRLAAGALRSGWRSAFALAGGAVGIVLWWSTSGPPQYLALSVVLAFLAIGQSKPEVGQRNLGAVLALTAFGYAVFAVIRDYGSLWPLLFSLSTKFTEAVASLLGTQASLGPTYSGMWLVIGFGIALLAVAALGRHASRLRVGLALVLLALVPIGAVGLHGLTPIGLRIGLPTPALGWRIAPFLLLLIPLVLFMSAGEMESPGNAAGGIRPRFFSRGGARVLPFVFAILILVGLVLLAWSGRVPARTGRVLLDARGDFMLEPLRWGQYGRDVPHGASIATLPPLLEGRGFSVTIHDTTLDAPLLETHDVVMVMNPTYDFSDEEIDTIYRFVSRGGGLLVLGDHTNIKGTMGPLNRLLGPTGVRIAFDSAIPQIPRWTWYGCMKVHPHPVTRGIRDETDVKVSVGASLELAGRVLPLLTGRDAYSDEGNWENEQGAYLGNMRHDREETLGDIPLVAHVSYGRGKVIVFGDTSTFQRSAIYNTHEWVTRIFTYLSIPGSAVAPPAMRITGGVALALGTAGLFVSGLGALPWIAALGLLGSSALVGIDQHGRVSLPPLVDRRPVAWIDLAHGNRVDLHSGADNGISGFVDHLWRGEYLPLGMKRFDAQAIRNASLFATVAPAFPFSKRERVVLREFVENGGLLIVATGYEERCGAEALLADFGYAIGATPIGAAHHATAHLEGQRVMMHESWPVIFPEGRASVWASCWDYPLITFEKIGRGGLLVIGDSIFLCNKKLEGREDFLEMNIDFLKAALETAWETIQSEGQR